MSESKPVPPAAAVVPRQPLSSIGMGQRGVSLTTLDELLRFGAWVIKSRLAPKGVDSAEQAALMVQAGLELGFSPFQSLQSLACINGRVGTYGDAGTAKVLESGLLDDRQELYEGKPGADDYTAICRLRRRGTSFYVVGTFSVGDAKRAKLWGKAGPWSDYPVRQMMWRARTYAYRDGFADVLKGLTFAEELQDLPPRDVEIMDTRPRPSTPIELAAIPLESTDPPSEPQRPDREPPPGVESIMGNAMQEPEVSDDDRIPSDIEDTLSDRFSSEGWKDDEVVAYAASQGFMLARRTKSEAVRRLAEQKPAKVAALLEALEELKPAGPWKKL